MLAFNLLSISLSLAIAHTVLLKDDFEPFLL
jgi:hypothetical protein